MIGQRSPRVHDETRDDPARRPGTDLHGPAAVPASVTSVDFRDPRWDEFVLATAEATVFHCSGWLCALERENGQRVVALACVEPDGSISGILPLMPTRGLPSLIGGTASARRLSSLPRTPLGGPVATSEEARRALLREAMRLARRGRRRLQVKTEGPTLEGLVPGLTGSPWRSSYVKTLPRDVEDLRFGDSRHQHRVLSAIKQARHMGLTVRSADTTDDLRDWYRLYLDVNRWHGLPPRPYRFFETAWENLRPNGILRLLLVERPGPRRGRLLAGSILLMLGDTVSYSFNGRLREALPMHPNDLLLWHAMRDATAAGFRRFDLGEVAEANRGLMEFKVKWGTEKRQLFHYDAPALPRPEGGYGLIDSPGPAHRLALRAWRRVPLSLTAAAGALAYRYM